MTGARPRLEHAAMTAVAVSFVAIGVFFRIYRFWDAPGISADEAWWGLEAMAVARGQIAQSQTMSANPISPFLLYPMAFVHWLFGPSPAALRAIPLVSNLVMLAVSYILGARVFGRAMAAIYVSILALLPAAIHYGRLAYDPSQSLLADSLVMLFALGSLREMKYIGMMLGAVLSFVAAIVIHPTNIFLAPYLAAVGILALKRHRQALLCHWRIAVGFGVLILVLAVAGWCVLGDYTEKRSYLNRPWGAIACENLANIIDGWEFAANFGRMFSGPGIYLYASVDGMTLWPYDLAGGIVGFAMVIGLHRVLSGRPTDCDWALIVPWIPSIILFYAISGSSSIGPGRHYGIWLVVPTALILARIIAQGLASQIARKPVLLASSVAGYLVLATFQTHYLEEFDRTGGRGFRNFTTSQTDPKAAAIALILERAPKEGPITVVSYDLWCNLPLRYFAAACPRVTVKPAGLPIDPDPAQYHAGRLFSVEYTRWHGRAGVTRWAAGQGPFVEWPISDSRGDEFITILSRAEK